MKKSNMILIGLLTAATCLFPVGCAEEKGASTPSVTRYTVYDFEGSLFGIKMSNDFGKVELNRDLQYVKTGEKSLKLTPATEPLRPYTYMPFNSRFLPAMKNNLRRITDVTLDVYATSATTVGVGLYYSERAEDMSNANVYQLQEGWNTITYENQLSIAELSNDIDSFYGVYFSYEQAENRPVVYLDNVTIGETKEDMVYESLIVLDRTNDHMEISDFERSYQNLILTPRNDGGLAKPEIGCVKASEYGLVAPSGERVLKIKPVTKASAEDTDSSTYLYFSKKFLTTVDWESIADSLGDYELKFEAYIACEDESEAYLDMSVDIDPSGNFKGYALTTATKANEWVRCSVSMTALEAFIANPANLRFRFHDGVDETRTIFIDDIRVVRKDAE